MPIMNVAARRDTLENLRDGRAGRDPATCEGEPVMGLGFLLLILLCVVGYFAFRPATFLNAAEAKFVRRGDPASGGIIFDITPARPSVTFTLFRAGVSAVTFWLLVSVMGANDASLGAIGFAAWVLVSFVLFRPLLKSQRYRKPTRLTISPQNLTADQRHYALKDIAQINIRCGLNTQDAPVRTAVVRAVDGVPVAGNRSISADVSRILHNRLAARSFLLTLRTSNGSAEDILSGGLTQRCAEALMHDLTISLRQAAVV